MPLLNNFSRSLACVTHAAAVNASDERPKQRELAQEVKQRIKELWRVGSCWWLRKKSEKKGHEKLEINFTYDSGRETHSAKQILVRMQMMNEAKKGERVIAFVRRGGWSERQNRFFPFSSAFPQHDNDDDNDAGFALCCVTSSMSWYTFSLSTSKTFDCCLQYVAVFLPTHFYFFVKVRHQKLEYMTTTSTLWLNRTVECTVRIRQRY